ncbi:DctP family TRAP transporter solute-binding subunit [Vreelandella populi]|uniref:DctP family TRAP transporter solute-binding subunit n=1 Tax=Vreelandella populi TaxID=2498858 RepID=A0A3S0WPG1_9GAMM|nr:DctP family TRAP transporter solute-binding subunit [Halomonas populi]RUR47664.1 DctP family TRAP transporter solute-binding subunit [Halomonas populi]RUR54472.1 DctP family TRAP transporter solute-binding subunit [Halomonas populi]
MVNNLASLFTPVLLKRLTGFAACLGLLSASLVSQAAEITPTTLRLAHVVNTEDTYHIAAARFQELVSEKTNGAVTVDIYPNASLGDERTLLEGMQIGTVDMGVITNGPVANFVDEFSVFELPFLFPSHEAAYSVLDGEVGQEILDKLEGVNLKGLAYAERGFRNITNSRNAINTPADLDGLRLRVIENEVYVDTFRTLGANAVPMAWTEALTALQQGTIDGQENPVNAIHAFNLAETQDYLTMTRHIYAPAIFIMSLPKWSGLQEEAQVAVLEAAQEASTYAREQNAVMEAEQLAELGEAGMEINESPDIEAFQAAVTPVYEKYGQQFGDYLPRIQEALQ